MDFSKVNNFKPILSKIKQSLYSLHQADQITKKIYENLMQQYMNLSPMDFINSMTNDLRFILDLWHKINLKIPSNHMALSKLNIFYT